MRFLTLTISLLLIQTTLTAQETKRCFRIDFGLESSKLDTGIRDNGKTMEDMLSYLGDAVRQPDTKIVSVVFVGSASPEGPASLNLRLAKERSAAAEKYVRARIELPDSIVSCQSRPQDWAALPALLGEGTVSGRLAEILSSGESSLQIQHSVERLDSGKVWKSLLAEHFPSMRNSGIIIVTTSRIGRLAKGTSSQDSLTAAHLLAAATTAEARPHIGGGIYLTHYQAI